MYAKAARVSGNTNREFHEQHRVKDGSLVSDWQMLKECEWEAAPWKLLDSTCRASTFIQKEAKQNRAAINGFISGILPATRVTQHPGVTSTTDRSPRDDGKALEN